MCLRQQPFTSEEVAIFAARSHAPVSRARYVEKNQKMQFKEVCR